MALTIYDHHLSYPDAPLFYEKIRELNCLEDMGDKFRFRVPDTDYYLFLTFSSFVWVYYPNNNEPELLNFEMLLDRLPTDKIELLIYHLDVFKHEKKNRK
jgi:hypothetical protein